MKDITPEIGELLFALESALPFVTAHVGNRLCSSNGGPAAIEALLKQYDWENNRHKWISAHDSEWETYLLWCLKERKADFENVTGDGPMYHFLFVNISD